MEAPCAGSLSQVDASAWSQVDASVSRHVCHWRGSCLVRRWTKIRRVNPQRRYGWKEDTRRLKFTGESERSEARGWSENASAMGAPEGSREKRGPQLCRPALFLGFTDKLRSVAGLFGWEEAARLGAYGVMQGAARAILEDGGSFSQLVRAGRWRSAPYRLYLDIRRIVCTWKPNVRDSLIP